MLSSDILRDGLGGHRHPLPPPNPFDALDVRLPPGLTEHGRDPPMAGTPVLRGEREVWSEKMRLSRGWALASLSG